MLQQPTHGPQPRPLTRCLVSKGPRWSVPWSGAAAMAGSESPGSDVQDRSKNTTGRVLPSSPAGLRPTPCVTMRHHEPATSDGKFAIVYPPFTARELTVHPRFTARD